MKKILIFLLLSLDVCIHAHLLVVQKNKDGFFEPISDENITKHNDAILNVLVRYTWPSCITSDLSDDEKGKLLVSKQGAEQNFVREKLKNIHAQLDVIFVPTTLYELFYINAYLHKMKQKCEKESLGEEISYLTDPEYIDDEVSNSLEEIEDILNEDESSVKQDVRQDGNKLSPAAYLKEEINELSQICNRKLFDNKDSFGYPNVLTVHQKFVSKFFNKSLNVAADVDKIIYEKRNHIIDYLIKDLIKIQKDVSSNEKIPKNYPIFYDWITNAEEDSGYNELLPSYSERYGLIQIIKLLEQNKKNQILQKTIDIEYEATKSNKGLLFRGSNVIQAKGLNGSVPIIGTTQQMGATLENQGLFSMSFGISLFAGAFFYIDAMAYAYLTELGGYALFIDKFQYVDNYNSNLFLIPGLTVEMALFGLGLWFHPRSKPVRLDKSKHDAPIIGIVTGQEYTEVIKDPYGIFLVTRDPYFQAYLFSKYLVENGTIIGNLNVQSLQNDEQIGLDILKNQKIHSGKNALELLAKKYKQRKSLNTKSISRLVDVLRELKIKLLEKKDQQEIELLIKKDKQEENLEIEKISKLVDVLRVLNN